MLLRFLLLLISIICNNQPTLNLTNNSPSPIAIVMVKIWILDFFKVPEFLDEIVQYFFLKKNKLGALTRWRRSWWWVRLISLIISAHGFGKIIGIFEAKFWGLRMLWRRLEVGRCFARWLEACLVPPAAALVLECCCARWLEVLRAMGTAAGGLWSVFQPKCPFNSLKSILSSNPQNNALKP